MDERRHAAECGQPRRRRRLAHLAIGANIGDRIRTVEVQIRSQPHLFSQLVVVGHDGIAFEGADELGCMKAVKLGIMVFPMPLLS
jgi:hypothetical protein